MDADAKSAATGSARLGRGAYFAAAFEILARGGSEALTIAALCRRLRVTKGSFYHHFDSMPDFVDRLLRDWEETFQAVLDEVAGLPDPIARFEITSRHVYELEHDAEAALRAWGHSNKAVGAAVARMDRAREQNYAATLAMVIDDPDRCRFLAHMGTSLLIGLQQRGRPVDRDRAQRVGLEWARVNLGLDAGIRVDEGVPYVHIRPGSIGPRLPVRDAS